MLDRSIITYLHFWYLETDFTVKAKQYSALYYFIIPFFFKLYTANLNNPYNWISRYWHVIVFKNECIISMCTIDSNKFTL